MRSALLCLALLAAACSGENIFSSTWHWVEHGVDSIFHTHVKKDVGDWWHGLAHKFEDDLQKIGKALEKIPKEMDDELHHLEHAFGPLWKDIEKATKEVVTFVRNFQPWLININSKIFGPELGPLLEKLEVAALEKIPIVGEAVALVTEGVDVYDDMVAAKKCWEKKDLHCVGEEIADALLKISGAMTEDFVNMRKFANALNKMAKIVEAGVTFSDAVTKNIPEIEQGIKDIEKGDVADILKGLGEIGTGLEGVISDLEHADPALVKRFQKISDVLKKFVAIDAEGQKIWAAGVDIKSHVDQLKACYSRKDWACIGEQIADIGKDIESVIPQNDAITKICQTLTGIPDDIAFAEDVVATFKAFDKVFIEVKGARSEAQWKNVVNDLSSALGMINGDITALNKAIGADIPDKIQKLEDHIKILVAQFQKANGEVNEHGFSIYDDIMLMAKEWKAKNYEQFAKTLLDLLQQIEAVAEDYPKLQQVVQALNEAIRVVKDAIAVDDIFTEAWPQLKKALYELGKGDLPDIAHGYIDLSDFITNIASQLSAVDPKLAAVIRQIAQYFNSEIKIASDLKHVFVAGLDVAPKVKAAVACFNKKDWTCVGNEIGDIIQAIKDDLPDWKITKDIIKGLTTLQNTTVLAADAHDTVTKFDQALQLLETPTASNIKQGLTVLGEALESIVVDIEQADKVTGGAYTELAKKLERDVEVAVDAEKKITGVTVDGIAIYGDVQDLTRCYKSHNWACVGQAIQQLKTDIQKLKPKMRKTARA